MRAFRLATRPSRWFDGTITRALLRQSWRRLADDRERRWDPPVLAAAARAARGRPVTDPSIHPTTALATRAANE